MGYKVKTLGEKQAIRYRMVYAALGTLIAIPVMALGLLLVGVDPSSANGIFATASATLGVIVVGFFGTSAKDDNAKGGEGV